jgi:two-component system chemotaxis sensor kinase CheA
MLAASYLATFVHEVEDLLERIESTTLELEARPNDPELIHQLFRAFHTLKGSAGVAGVGTIASFTHHVETAMDKVRGGAIALSPGLVSAVLESKDHVAALLEEALGNAACDHARGDAIVATLVALTGETATAKPAETKPAPLPQPEPASVFEVQYLVTFTVTGDLTELDIDAAAYEAELAVLGTCEVLAPLPAWRAFVTTTRGENAVRDAFLFVHNHGELTVEAGLCMFVDDPEPAPAPAPVVEAAAPAPAPVPAAPVAAPAPAAAAAPAARRTADSTVRVSSERLDQLVKLIGELVITQSRLEAAHLQRGLPELAGPVEAMDRLIADLRDGVLGLRMVPIGTMFTRFHRLVRDLTGELAKDVELITEGDDTELDKSVIDQLGDALVHILRNSLDHGLETPDVREAAGKRRTGTLRLSAAHEGTHVVITIADDGRGIDTAAVRRKAEEKGLIAPGEILSEQEALGLIMRPGFSTAAAVTQLSGRGVGMDVVKKTVEGLRGSLSLTSTVGAGTTIRLKLPLTLAIIDGLLVEIRGDRFIVPMAAVTENLELSAAERRSNNGRNLVAVRGEMVPYIRLRELFGLGDTHDALEKIVVVTVDGQRVGLVVDRVIGNHQTVIQPLGRFYRGVDLFSGTTILGDGRVAMILDLAGTTRSVGTAPHGAS